MSYSNDDTPEAPLPMSSHRAVDEAFVRGLAKAFDTQLFAPLHARAATDPASVQRVIDTVRVRLDLLQRSLDVLSALAGGMASGSAAPAAPLSAAVEDDPAATGPLTARPAAADAEERPGSANVRRRQRSLVREMVLLEIMEREGRPVTLAELIAEITPMGLTDSPGAVVTQLNRLKTAGLVDRPADGIYKITAEGARHLAEQQLHFSDLRRLVIGR